MVEQLTLDSTLERIQWALAWSEPTGEPPRSAVDATSGTLTVKISGTELWGAADPDWSWIELLEWLTRSWVWLRGEDGLPLAVSSYLGSSPVVSLGALKAKLEQETYGESAAGRSRAQMSLWDFLETHDLSRALAGASAPSIVLWREGLVGHVLTDDSRYFAHWSHVLEALNGLGNKIASRLDQLHGDERAQAALNAWKSRDDVPVSDWLRIARGQDDPASTVPLPTQWDDLQADQVEHSPILAAARMTSRLTANLADSILKQIAGIPLNKSSIDAVSLEVQKTLSVEVSSPPWEQGYEFARAFRRYLGPGENPFKPDAWLKSVGVSVHDVRLATKDVEAIAVWGPRNGPAVLINRDGLASSRASGRNASLAHEIGHLLMDRAGALPAAEVLGGKVDPLVEQRARAFAVEILLPKSVAGARLSNAAEVREVRTLVASLANRYGVSHEVVAWQVRNSDVPLHADIIEYLRTLVSYPDRF